jgi:hypothetical protein
MSRSLSRLNATPFEAGFTVTHIPESQLFLKVKSGFWCHVFRGIGWILSQTFGFLNTECSKTYKSDSNTQKFAAFGSKDHQISLA